MFIVIHDYISFISNNQCKIRYQLPRFGTR